MPEQERNDLEMMRHPERWPLGFHLPLKRRDKTGTGYEVGTLMVWDVDSYLWWPGKSMFEHKAPNTAQELRTDELQDLVEQGWVVD